MPGKLFERNAIVTGASSGLGRAIALAFASEGANVVCADLSPSSKTEEETMETTHDLINKMGKGRAIYMKCDVGEENDVQALVDKCVSEFGRLDIMVNNAGVAVEAHTAGLKPIHETDVSTYDLTMRINSRSIFLGCKHACGQMLKQDPLPINDRGDRDRGWIINTASMLGLVATKLIPSYCASKGAAVQLTRQVAIDYAPHKIHCNCLCPGYIETHMTKPNWSVPETRTELESLHPWGTWGRPHDVAKAAVFLACEDSGFVTGHPLVIDGGYISQ